MGNAPCHLDESRKLGHHSKPPQYAFDKEVTKVKNTDEERIYPQLDVNNNHETVITEDVKDSKVAVEALKVEAS